jgi:hypothetical protein
VGEIEDGFVGCGRLGVLVRFWAFGLDFWGFGIVVCFSLFLREVVVNEIYGNLRLGRVFIGVVMISMEYIGCYNFVIVMII